MGVRVPQHVPKYLYGVTDSIRYYEYRDQGSNPCKDAKRREIHYEINKRLSGEKESQMTVNH